MIRFITSTFFTGCLFAGCLLTATAHSANIEFWYGNTGKPEEAIQAACATFNQQQSDHQVTCVGQGSYEAGMQKAIAAVRSNKHPVLIQFFDAGTLDIMLSDAVLSVQELMPDAPWQDYIGGARSYYETSTGELMSQPYNSSTLLFYANTDHLAAAGVDDVPSTWEQVIDAARKLKASGHACPFTTDAHPWRVLEQFSSRHGTAIASRQNGYGGLDAEYTFNKGLVAKHLNNLATWRQEGLVLLSQDTKAGRYNAAFNTDECAMMEASTGSYGAAFSALGEKVALTMAPMYAGVKRHNTFVGGGSIWVMKGHDEGQYQGAKAFLDFLRTHEQQIAFTQATGYTLVTKGALTDLRASGRANEPQFAPVELGVQSMNQPGTQDTRGIRLGFYVQFRDIFKQETEKAWTGEQSMQAALDKAKTRGDELLRRFEQTYQGKKLP
ncbi:MAG: extracellular solute-binding protein [Pseudomonadota bacterium]